MKLDFRKILVTLLIGASLLLASSAITLHADTSLQDEEALTLLRNKLRQDELYPRMDCLMFISDRHDKQAAAFEIREKHDDKCGGDPDVAPIVDRFRVNRSSKQIEWYNVMEDEYLPYSEFVNRSKP